MKILTVLVENMRRHYEYGDITIELIQTGNKKALTTGN